MLKMEITSFPVVFLTVIIYCFLTTPTLPNAAAAIGKAELATEVCKNTTAFSFCRELIYSDPRAPTADRYVLNYIAFGKAYQNATDTQNYINQKLKSGVGGDSEIIKTGLIKCKGYYDEAVRAVEEALRDLDDETIYDMDKIAIHIGGCSRSCEASCKGNSPMSEKNNDLNKIAGVCVAVAKLYEYHV